MTVLRPRDARDVESAIAWAASRGEPLEVIGRGSKRAIGRAPRPRASLDLSALAGVLFYEPEELVLSAHAATPLAKIEELLAAQGQMLAFEPMDCAALLGASAPATLGGVVGVNLSGPRRLKAGAARDHVLGATAVSGRGETFKTGGRVVKNVTGYDLSELLAGSFGTLAAVTTLTMKTLPRAETEATLAVLGLDDAMAMAAMAAAMGSSCEASAAAHLPPATLAACHASGLPADRAATVFRLEGVAPSVASRREGLAELLRGRGDLATLSDDASRVLWRAVRDVAPFAAAGRFGACPVWRISTVPSAGAAVGETLRRQASAEIFYDWAGGLIWAAVAPSSDAGAACVRAALAGVGGHATLIRAPEEIRARVAVFEPPPPPLAALTRRIKDNFDPKGVLNPGRMWPEA